LEGLTVQKVTFDRAHLERLIARDAEATAAFQEVATGRKLSEHDRRALYFGHRQGAVCVLAELERLARLGQ